MSAPSPTPISLLTSPIVLLSRPLAVNLAYSLSATSALLIHTVLVSAIPKVRVHCLLAMLVVIVVAKLASSPRAFASSSNVSRAAGAALTKSSTAVVIRLSTSVSV